MKIVIEGADGTGKTTLAKYLISTYNLDYMHLDSKTKNDFIFHKDLIDNNKDIVFDRFYLGEFIYSNIFNRICKISNKELEILSKKLEEEEVFLFILCASNINLVKKRLDKRGEESFIKKEIEKINNGFIAYGWILRNYKNVFVIDINKEDPIYFVEELLKEVNK